MTKKKSTPPAEDKEEKALEEKIRKMLDPREPDPPKIELVEDKLEEDGEVALPTKIEIKEHGEAEDVAAPEIKSEEVQGAPEISSKKIEVTHDEDGVTEDEPESETAEVTDEASSPPEVEANEAEQEESESEELELDDVSASDEEVEEALEEDTVADAKEKTDDLPEPEPEPEPESQKPDEELDKAVDDIARAESDQLLQEDDKKAAKALETKKPTLKARIGHFFKAWWHNKLARYATIFILIFGIVAAGVYPTSRYLVLNAFGVRSSASIRIIDESTLQPLKNVQVEINGVQASTNIEGVAELHNVRLGKTELKISKRAFRDINKSLTVGWGSNPLSDEQLTPIGTQYSFVVTDFVSEKPVQGVEAVSGDASALSNEKGEIKLTLDMPDDVFETQIIGEGFRTETLSINADEEKTYEVKLAPSKKHVFMSRRNGTYDVYAAYADGKNEELLLAGTGSEREDITLVPHPSRDIAALVSTRSGERNADGYQVSTLTIIDINNKDKPKKVVDSERIQIIGWEDQRLVFVQIRSGTSAADPLRHQLKTYNLDEGTAAELASANYFNDVMLADSLLLFAPSSAYAKTPAGLYRINPDGSDQQIVHPDEVWSMFRASYDNVTFTTGRDWFSFSISNMNTEQLSGQPTDYKSRVYVNSPDGMKSLRIDQRDGKGTLIVYDIKNDEEKTVLERGGLQLPIGWLNTTTLVFRVKTESESADYVINVDGGEPKKVADVTNAAGLDRWYDDENHTPHPPAQRVSS